MGGGLEQIAIPWQRPAAWNRPGGGGAAATGAILQARLAPPRPAGQFPPVPDDPPFWKTKSLDAMTRAEWESLCDGCGRCCLHKLRDEDSGELAFTNVACRLLHLETAQCSDYARRQRWVPDCVKLTPKRLQTIDWLPPSCAYRLVAEGQDLAWWHPLVSGRAETVREAGISVLGRVVRERDAGDLEDHVAAWPGRIPRSARPKPAGGAENQPEPSPSDPDKEDTP
jgi:uncharacterized cysteine cluster protein YcgN (CxxCxxCC family)